jgi:hypothetical protein
MTSASILTQNVADLEVLNEESHNALNFKIDFVFAIGNVTFNSLGNLLNTSTPVT